MLSLLQMSCTGREIGNLAIKSIWWIFVQVNSSIGNTISLISMHVALMAEQYFLCHFNVPWDSIWFFIKVSALPIKPFHNVIQRPIESWTFLICHSQSRKKCGLVINQLDLKWSTYNFPCAFHSCPDTFWLPHLFVIY